MSLTLPVDALHQPSVLDLSDPPLPPAWLQSKPSPFSLSPTSRSPNPLVIPLCAVPTGDQALLSVPGELSFGTNACTPPFSTTHRLTQTSDCCPGTSWPLSICHRSARMVRHSKRWLLSAWSEGQRGTAMPSDPALSHSGHPMGEQRNHLISQIANKFITAISFLFTGDRRHIFGLF